MLICFSEIQPRSDHCANRFVAASVAVTSQQRMLTGVLTRGDCAACPSSICFGSHRGSALASGMSQVKGSFPSSVTVAIMQQLLQRPPQALPKRKVLANIPVFSHQSSQTAKTRHISLILDLLPENLLAKQMARRCTPSCCTANRATANVLASLA